MAAARISSVVVGGTIVDGTGGAPFVGDIAIGEDGRIVAVGAKLEVPPGARVVQAKGLLVTPGWIDVHTHLDCQVTFDGYMTPLAENGVTTAVMGNCGVGFAPCRKEDREFLMGLMEGVEDIPLGAMTAGMKWEWETFPQFLDALDRKKLAFDIGCLIGHGPVRAYVMGKRANLMDRPGGPERNPVTQEEMEQIAKIVGEAITAGALGFSTSRTLLHRDRDGILVPGTLAHEDELMIIGKAMAEAGRWKSSPPVFEMASDFMSGADEPQSEKNHADRIKHFGREWIWIQTLSKGYGIKVNFGFGMPSRPGPASKGFRTQLLKLDSARAAGADVMAQVFVRPQGVLMCWDSRSHPFIHSATFDAIWREGKSASNKVSFSKEKLLDPKIKAKIIAETIKMVSESTTEAHFGIVLPQTTDDGNAGNLNGALNSIGALAKMYFDGAFNIFRWTKEYEPPFESSVLFAAKKENRHVFEVVYDWLCEDNFSRVLTYLFMNYATPSLDDTLEILLHEGTIPGLGDTGAHLGFLADPTAHTYLLTYLVRDRTRGPRLRLETAVKLHTADVADSFGLNDRGRLVPGKLADLNLIDFARLEIHEPKLCHDFPLGASRWVQRSSGYVMTIKSGEITHVEGKPTGVMPGKLVRSRNAGKDKAEEYPFDTISGRVNMFLHKMKWETEQKFVETLLAVLGPARLENLGIQMVANKPLPLSKL